LRTVSEPSDLSTDSSAETTDAKVDEFAVDAIPRRVGHGLIQPDPTLGSDDEAEPELPDVLLIRGCPRSGTTFVAEIVNTSPHAAIIFEYSLGALCRDLEPILAYGRSHLDLRAMMAYAHTVTDETSYYNRPKKAPVVRYPVKERFAEILASVVAATLRKRDVTLIGSKTPGAQALGDRASLRPFFDRIKYIFVVRNPLTTINSMLNRRNLTRLGVDDWPIETVAAAINEYRQSVNVLLSHLSRFPGECFVVKYEDLQNDFTATASAMSEFLQVPFVVQTAESEDRAALLRRKPESTRDVLEPDEMTAVLQEFSDAIDDWDQLTLRGTDPALGQRLSGCADALTIGKRYRYHSGDVNRPFLGMGWSVLQPEGVWTDDVRADLFFTSSYEGDVVAYLNASFFLPPGVETLSLRIEGNGREVFRGTCVTGEADLVDATSGPLRIFAGPGPRALVCGPIRLTGTGIQQLSLHIDDPRSPLEVGLSNDDRKLGLLLHSIVLAPA
jgi:hypothetical protein